MGIKIEEVTKPVTLGEGPHWDAERQLLYFVSIMDSTIHKYDPATQLETRTKLPENVSFIVPLAGTSDQFAIALGRRVVVIRWDGNNDSAAEVIKTIAEVDTEPGLEDNKLNDGKADPRGRLFAGTLAKTSIVDGKFIVDEDTLGSLYSFSAKGAQKWDNGVRLSNGLCWNVDRKTMYYVDTLINVVYGYDYDVNIGSATNRRIVFDYKKTKLPGMLDGMTIDTDGNLWIATFEGSQVIKVDPVKGEIIQKVALPISQITSVTFGGKDLDELYVTSGNLQLREKQEPPSGAMLKVTGLNVRGYAGIPCVL